LIARELKAGDPEEKVVAFFKERGWSYSYDKWNDCYRSRRDELERCDGFSKVIVVVYMDGEHRIDRTEVEVHHTFI
jgi:hypothetical protein